MYDLNDTIAAVSSGTAPAVKKIIRVSGNRTFDVLKSLTGCDFQRQRGIVHSFLNIDGLETEAVIYIFVLPSSYTAEDLAELHICACDDAIEKLFARLLETGCRAALAGEFTYRAYVNGKIDLSRAEAIAEMIESSNQYQLAAAQKLFGGSIENQVLQIRNNILELLSLIEAGLDFSAEDIEIISKAGAVESVNKIEKDLSQLLSGSITFEQISQAPSVVVAGAPNAGKSSLVNALLGVNRSIVSEQRGTTRDILEHWLKLEKCDCVLFDCAGIMTNTDDILADLAGSAAIKAISGAAVLIFCVDAAKQDYSEDLAILRNIVRPQARSAVIYAATKCDLINENSKLEKVFGCEFLKVSAQKNVNLDKLKKLIEQNIINQTAKTAEAGEKTSLTERHRRIVNESLKNIQQAGLEMENGSEEIAAHLLRKAIQSLSKLETEHIDEAILSAIFSRFCIGK